MSKYIKLRILDNLSNYFFNNHMKTEIKTFEAWKLLELITDLIFELRFDYEYKHHNYLVKISEIK